MSGDSTLKLEQTEHTTMNRRQFIWYLSTILAALTYSFGRKVLEPLQGQFRTKKDAHVELTHFIEQHKKLLQKIEFGCTFSPEYFTGLAPDVTPQQVVELFKKLHLTKVRFTMRWSHCVNADNQVDISFYEPWLKSFIAAGMEITLSCGPIKTPRWPESFVPAHISEVLEQTTQSGSQYVSASSPLGEAAINFLERLLIELKPLAGERLQKIAMFNLENEFRNPFGDGQYLMNLDYMIELYKRVTAVKPEAAFLLNNAGVSGSSTSALEQTTAAVTQLAQAFPQASFTVGLDVYEEQNMIGKVPYLGLHPDTITGLFVLHEPNLIEDTVTQLEAGGIQLEATELQFERWGDADRPYPPGTLYHLQYMLLRYCRHFLGKQPQVIRLWGIEQFMQKYLENPEDIELNQITELVVTTNTLSK